MTFWSLIVTKTTTKDKENSLSIVGTTLSYVGTISITIKLDNGPSRYANKLWKLKEKGDHIILKNTKRKKEEEGN